MQSFVGSQFEYKYGYEQGMYNTKPAGTREKKGGLKASEKKMMLVMVLLAGLIGILIIVSAAYSAQINYNNTQLRNEIATLEGEVQSLQVDIQSANNIAMIEKTATGQLGMVYADGEKCVTIKSAKQPTKNFAAKLKKEAFN